MTIALNINNNQNNQINQNNHYSLHNLENYYGTLKNNQEEIQIKYNHLLNDYLFFILENIQMKKESFYRFIIQRGLETVTHVFNLILLYSKNLEMTHYHSQKAFYFYVEFIGQISVDQHMFLQLSSRDAIMFVYKKTIFDIHSEMKKKKVTYSKQEKSLFEHLEKFQKIQHKLISIILEEANISSAEVKQSIAPFMSDMNKIEKMMQNIISYKWENVQLETFFLFLEKLHPLTIVKNISTTKEFLYIAIECFFKYQKSITETTKNKLLTWEPQINEICSTEQIEKYIISELF